jgi:hypothetical protein
MIQMTSPTGLPVRWVFLWLYVLAASVVAVGILVQAFSIAAYVREAGLDELDLHTTDLLIRAERDTDSLMNEKTRRVLTLGEHMFAM